MSDEEKQRLKLNCLTDFQRAAVAYFTNPEGKTCLIFFDHGVGLLRKMRKRNLVNRSQRLRNELLKFRRPKIRIAEDILTLGLLAKPV